MATRGRKPGFRMSDEHRVKIQNSNVLNALIEHAEGKREMSSTQVTAGVALIRKVLPDLASVDVDASVEHDVSDPFADLLTRIATGGKRLASAGDDQP